MNVDGSVVPVEVADVPAIRSLIRVAVRQCITLVESAVEFLPGDAGHSIDPRRRVTTSRR